MTLATLFPIRISHSVWYIEISYSFVIEGLYQWFLFLVLNAIIIVF